MCPQGPLVHQQWHSPSEWSGWNIKRDQDVYTNLNWISLTIWTICAFREQNPHQWFLAKQSSLKSWKDMSQKKLKPKGMPCNKSTKLQFQSISTRKILMLSKRYESTEVERRTWLHVPSGELLSTSCDTSGWSDVCMPDIWRLYLSPSHRLRQEWNRS